MSTTNQDFATAIENALEEFACTNDNPCGGTGYHDEGEDLPFRVLYCDGVDESFATAEEAIEAAEEYAETARRELAEEAAAIARDRHEN